MKTNRQFHSPFYLLALLLTFACAKKETIHKSADEKAIAVLLLNANDTLQPISQRISSSSKAFDLAFKINNDTLVARTFGIKYALLYQNSPDSINPFLNEYLEKSLSNNDQLNLANAYDLLGEKSKQSQSYESAFRYFNDAKIIHENRKDTTQILYKLLQISDIYRQYNDYTELEKTATDAIALSVHPKDSVYKPIFYNNLGIAAKGLYDYTAAIKYYNLVIENSNDRLSKAIAANNIAVAYTNVGNYQKAIGILSRLSKSDVVNAHHETKARTDCNLGYALWKSGNQSGLSLMLDSEIQRLQMDDSGGLVSTWIHLAEAYQNTDAKLSSDYAFRAYKKSVELRSPDDQLEALGYLIKCSSDSMSKNYSEHYMNISDSIRRVRQSAKNQFAKIRYDSRKEKEENFQLKADQFQKALQLEKRKRQTELLFALLFFIICTGVLLYFLLRKKHRRDKIRESYKTETRIAKKVHDELANDVFHTMTFAETQDLSDAENKEQLLKSLDSIYARSRDISRENNIVDTGIDYINQLREMLSEYNNGERNVIIHGLDAVNWANISDVKKVTIYRVLQEIMVNMKKHSNSSIAAIRFKNGQQNIGIDYSDKGIGMQINSGIFKNGLRNVENRINSIGGTVTFESEPEKGLKIAINFPA